MALANQVIQVQASKRKPRRLGLIALLGDEAFSIALCHEYELFGAASHGMHIP
jgi:hypothetical protein